MRHAASSGRVKDLHPIVYALFACTHLRPLECMYDRLLGLLRKESDQVVSVLSLLETTERHLRAWNVLLWVL